MPLGQLHGYAAAMTSSFDPHLWDHDNLPIVYRPDGRPPPPDWFKFRGLSAWRRRGASTTLSSPHPRSAPQVLGAELVREAGEWRLYAVRK